MMKRFRITKIGLLNFWLYDEEEYDFYGGKLILRGINGSGKSVTMQSFIPLILDGNKSPDRLDPFGSKERKIEDYILGDADGVQKEESIAYLYMETYNEEENKYITIGLGFRGRKGKPVESWGFALKDGKRVLKDFYLYKDPVNKIPLSKNELKSRLGDFNEFTDTMKDYKAMVNRLLFGFPNLDVYDEFIKLLLQLRSNKLSKDYKPTNLIDVLNKVLQPLSEEDLRPLSLAIEQMNGAKERIETLESNLKKLNDFLRVYRNYNEAVILEKARNYKKENDEYNLEKKKLLDTENEINSLKEELENKNARHGEVLEELDINLENKKQLDNTDLNKKVESLSRINESINVLNDKVSVLDKNLEKDEETKLELDIKISELSNEIYGLKKDITDLCTSLKDTKDDSYFGEIAFFVDELMLNMDKEFSFDSIFMSLRSYLEKINLLITYFEEQSKLFSESESTRIEREKLERDYKFLESDIKGLESKRKDAIKTWEEDFINLINNNKFLKLSDLNKKQIFGYIEDYSLSNFEKIVRLYKSCSNDLINNIIRNNLILDSKKDKKREELSLLEIQYYEVNNADTLELPINLDTNRILEENGINNIPLYKCIEFKRDVSDNFRDKIESALFSSNILNARVINESDLSRVRNLDVEVVFLTKASKKKNNLLKYFDVNADDVNINKKYICEILESISVSEEDEVSILVDGISKIGALRVKADKKYKQMYIGYKKRLELKNRKLSELKESMNFIKNEISKIDDLILDGNAQISVIEEEARSLPSSDSINEIISKINELNIKLSYNDERQKELEKVLSSFDLKLGELRDKIMENSKGLSIPLNLEQYKIVSKVVASIKESLQELKNLHSNYVNKLITIEGFKERLDYIINNIAFVKAERNEKERELNVNIASRDTINELLSSKEYVDEKEKIIELDSLIKDLSNEKEDLVRSISKLEERLKNKNELFATLKESVNFKENRSNVFREVFLREYNLGYLYKNVDDDIDLKVNSVISDYGSKKNISVVETSNNFWVMYNKYSLDLADYSFKSITLFNDYDGDNEIFKKIYDSNVRIDITAMYQGVSVSAIELADKIYDDIEEGKLLIDKEDRHLFEDILLNTVGNKIRDRIHASNEWVSKINEIMRKMQENSALSFKLVWKSVSAESEEELDTREIVRMLKMEPGLLSDVDSVKITNHFRSKLRKAEELYKDSYVSFYKIVEDILDYRNWFSFILMYQRKGDNLKELTDKTFSKFSGGERAKSMYIPLFASVFAKYNMARSDALRIIALDEAFAGVDEDNIREMFGILKFLDIDYIINSQVLWGDYDTIPDISICELIRPANSQVVTVERYRWNGKYKEIINNRKEYNEELENA